MMFVVWLDGCRPVMSSGFLPSISFAYITLPVHATQSFITLSDACIAFLIACRHHAVSSKSKVVRWCVRVKKVGFKGIYSVCMHATQPVARNSSREENRSNRTGSAESETEEEAGEEEDEEATGA